MDFQHWLHEAVNQLRDSDSPRRDAEILLEYVTGKGRTYIMAFGETPLTDVQQQQLADLLQRRKQGEPIAYLTGLREFWSLPLFVSPRHANPAPGYRMSGGTGVGAIAGKNLSYSGFRHRNRRDCAGAGLRATGLRGDCGRSYA
ncbi:N5-glutamine S-adenosyl-L-methionine-dependent methyltransferase [Salmonella enterica subsp. enterica]|uniref:N5-glutamine S-adenosyl-L-methionine-dependent methyltransferase n=1 Tax=Salmonella enterica I TaxID=59201 RepID=A0A3S4IK73_SALET|nr:N5-glutamine S-adenosyl-L-methionine-dependent methyltransferase [Salmonella enterica subsp. enterica]